MKSDKTFNRLAKGSFFLVLDNIANLGIGALFWLILAKMTDPTIIGQAMVITGLATTVIGFTGYGIQVGLSKYLSEYNAKNMPNTAKRILRNGIRGSLILSGIMAVIISILSGQITTLAYHDSTLTILLIFTMVTFLPTQTIVSALIGAYQGMHMAKYVTITDSIFQGSRLAFALLALLYGLDVFGILLGFTLASCLALVISYCYLLPRAIPETEEKDQKLEDTRTKHVASFMSLNYLTVGSKVLSHQLGVLILGTQSFESAAFYGLALLISKLVLSFSHSVGNALLPTASEQIVNGDKTELKKIVNTAVRMSILISGFGFIVLMIDPMYLLSLISDSYIEAGWALRILTVSAILIAITSILTSVLNAVNRAIDVAKTGMASSITIIVLTFILTPIMSLEGAAIAMLIGSVQGLIWSLIILKQKENMIISSRSIINPFSAIISGLVVGYLFVIWNQVLLGIILAVACYAVASIAYRATTRSEIRQMIKIATKRSVI
jgi:O-antigen/teichoic acid export membrane protein